MSEQSVWDTLRDMGAILKDDHFVYTKGGHGSEYVNKDALFMHPAGFSKLCSMIADEFRDMFGTPLPDVVLGPAVGGALVAQQVAYHLGANSRSKPLAIYADKEGDGFVLKRGYDEKVPGKKILIVEDILNTGGSVKQVVELARTHGGDVIGVGAICNRGDVRIVDIGKPPKLFSVVSTRMVMYDSSQCPLCAEGRPINTKIGKGKEYVEKHGQPKVPDYEDS
ncbi:phosphoribosyltransferase [bacterium]|nr:phosphoribosyltransferase [bacterium]